MVLCCGVVEIFDSGYSGLLLYFMGKNGFVKVMVIKDFKYHN